VTATTAHDNVDKGAAKGVREADLLGGDFVFRAAAEDVRRVAGGRGVGDARSGNQAGFVASEMGGFEDGTDGGAIIVDGNGCRMSVDG
jgi:hypothetical protein